MTLGPKVFVLRRLQKQRSEFRNLPWLRVSVRLIRKLSMIPEWCKEQSCLFWRGDCRSKGHEPGHCPAFESWWKCYGAGGEVIFSYVIEWYISKYQDFEKLLRNLFVNKCEHLWNFPAVTLRLHTLNRIDDRQIVLDPWNSLLYCRL